MTSTVIRCAACRDLASLDDVIPIREDLAKKLCYGWVHKPTHCKTVRDALRRLPQSNPKKLMTQVYVDLQNTLADSLGDIIDTVESESKRWLVTCVVENTTVNQAALESLKKLAAYLDATLLVYVVPERGKDTFIADVVVPYLAFSSTVLCDSLEVSNPSKMYVTNANPLRGAHGHSCHTLVPFPKNKLKTKPYMARTGVNWYTLTTGTISNPPDQRGAVLSKHFAVEHWYFGAVLVTSDPKDPPLQIPICEDGSIETVIDGGLRVEQGVLSHTPVTRLAYLPDLHLETASGAFLEALRSELRGLSVPEVVVGDLFNFERGSHHNSLIKEANLGVSGVRDPLETIKYLCQWLLCFTNSTEVKRITVVDSNHHAHLEKWLNRFYRNPDPALLKAHTFIMYVLLWVAEPNQPLLEALAKYIAPELGGSVHWLRPNDEYVVDGIHNESHGHRGFDGAYFNSSAFAKSNIPITRGHAHSAEVMDTTFTVGTTNYQDYACGWSTWSGAYVIQYKNGTRAMILRPLPAAK